MFENRKPELLAPAGDCYCAKAAILAGADAVYMGLKKFNARERASNLGLEELSEIISIAHSKGIKVYVTMNTLLTDSELYEAVDCASDIYAAGADAIIVQDPGLVYILNCYVKGLDIHASTQMTTHNCLQVEFLSRLGIKNINFARELSEFELEKIVAFTKDKGLTSEIFVHGAYCISCSGICYMSSFISSQAGNRGKCLQPCRRRYSIVPRGDKKYFFSLKDNNALDNIESVLKTGADALKIEGRIKNYNYVYTTVSAWRAALDKKETESDVHQVFNRGFSTGYFDGAISPAMFVASPLDQSMERIGTVHSYTADRQELVIESVGRQIEEGDRINIYTPENSFICGAMVRRELAFNHYKIEIEDLLHGRILKGQIITLLPKVERMQNLKEQLDKMLPMKLNLAVEAFAQEDKPLKAVFTLGSKKTVVESSVPLVPAQNKGLSADSIKVQFEKTGDMLCTLGSLVCHGLDKPLFLPVKELNRMRRTALESLFAKSPKPQVPHIAFDVKRDKSISVLVSNQEDALLFRGKCNMIFAEWTPASKVDLIENVYPWIPAFVGDRSVDEYLRMLDTKPEYLVSDNVGLGLEAAKRSIKWIAGPMLNSSNSYSLKTYMEVAGASGAFLSTELNQEQLAQISAPADFKLFMQVYGPITMMTTRQCLLASCGRCRSGRNMFTAECENCSGSETFYDEKEIPFHIIKTPGYINRVFNDAILYIPEAVEQVNADSFLLDFRSLPFLGISQAGKLAIFDFFAGDRKKYAEAKNAAGFITRGNYQRGF